MRCLVIEPKLMLSDALCARLRGLGFVPVSASSVRAAEEHFADQLLLFILCDATHSIDALTATRGIWPSVGLIAVAQTPATPGNPDGGQIYARDAGAVTALPMEFTDAELRAAIAVALTPRSRSNAPAHILLVDDSAPLRGMAKSVLNRLRARVTLADCMEEALEVIDLIDIDCVVTDIFMPGMGGIVGIEKIRQSRIDLPIVAMSGGFEQRAKPAVALQAAHRTGADVLLAKPFDGVLLSTAIRQAMHAHRPRRGARSKYPSAPAARKQANF